MKPTRRPWIALLLCVLAPSKARAEGPWRISQDTLVYSDDDSVLVVSPQLAVRRRIEGGEVQVREVVDAVSAASVDLVSAASKRFTEVRSEVDVDARRAFGRWLPSLGYAFSKERDYTSHAVSAALETQLGSPDTTLQVGWSLSLDRIGRAQTSRAVFERDLTSHGAEVTLTQVLGPRTVARAVYTLTVQDGYLEKPYRYVPLFEQATVDMLAARGETLGLYNFTRWSDAVRPPEEVPDLRVGHAVAVRLLRWLGRLGAARLDYQLYLDDWGIVAHTVEPTLSTPLGKQLTVSLFGRLYAQAAASFWRRTYVVTRGVLPRYRTLDRELSTYQNLTGGARVEWQHGDALSLYGEASAMRTGYDDYLLLSQRLALIGQVGVRWTP